MMLPPKLTTAMLIFVLMILVGTGGLVVVAFKAREAAARADHRAIKVMGTMLDAFETELKQPEVDDDDQE